MRGLISVHIFIYIFYSEHVVGVIWAVMKSDHKWSAELMRCIMDTGVNCIVPSCKLVNYERRVKPSVNRLNVSKEDFF